MQGHAMHVKIYIKACSVMHKNEYMWRTAIHMQWLAIMDVLLMIHTSTIDILLVFISGLFTN